MTQVVEKQEVSNDFEIINNNFEGLIEKNYTLCNQNNNIKISGINSISNYCFNISHEIIPLMTAIMSDYFRSRTDRSAINHCLGDNSEIKTKFGSLPEVRKFSLTNILHNLYRNTDVVHISKSPDASARLRKNGVVKDIPVLKSQVLSIIRYSLDQMGFNDYSYEIFHNLLNPSSISKEEIEDIFSGQKIANHGFSKLPTRVGKTFAIGNHYLYSYHEVGGVNFHIAPAILLDDFYYHFSRNAVSLPVDITRVMYLIDSELFKEDYPYSSIKRYFDEIFLPEILKYNTTIVKVPSEFITMIHKGKNSDLPKNIMERKRVKAELCNAIKNAF